MAERVDIKLGWSCNNRCRFCVQGRKRERYPDRTTGEVMRLLEEARASADQVVLTGGEVTIRRDLPEIVRQARALGFKVIQIQTNGRRLADPALCDALIEAGATEFSPALHGPDPESHDWLTRAPGSFRQTVRAILNLRRRGARVVTNTVVTRPVIGRLAELGHLLVRLGVAQYQLAFPHALGSAAENFDQVVPRFEIIADDLRAGLEPGIRAGIAVMTEAVPLCILGESHRRYAAESLIPRTKIFDAEGQVLEDYSEYRVTEGKAKGPPCDECLLSSQCEGPWREYPERFGWSEMRPFGRR